MTPAQSAYPALIRMAIAMNRENREAHEHLRAGTHPMVWARDFCTVRVDVGHDIGANAQRGDLVIVPDARAAERSERPYRTVTARDLRIDGPRGERFSTIWVDEPNRCFMVPQFDAAFYLLVHQDMNQTFVMLGR